ncbi:unnamed protein product [Ilex paraguariensis]|uniref:Pentatricopeptide repeat-containing protein n=1 Tax=Ilex paraguariensis TaxID=185542 RepID=A0ABC8SP70_9AQUA
MLRVLHVLSRSPLSSLLFTAQRHDHHHVLVAATATEDLFVSLLSQCSNAKHLYQFHGFMVPRALDHDNLLLGRFIDACTALGFADYGYSVFAHKPQPDIYLYNTMIKVKALSHHSHSAKDAIDLYNKALVAGLRPDSYTLPFILKVVVRLCAIEFGGEVHCLAIRTGLGCDVRVAAALIQMYSSCGCVDDARKVFEEMRYRGLASWNVMVVGYAKVGDLDRARNLFERMPVRDVISWTAVIAGYAQVNRSSEAITMFRKMQLEGVEPDEITMLAALSACAHLGALQLGEWISHYIDKHRLPRTVPLYNALIDMYAKSGNIKKAIEVFEDMNSRSVVTWTTIIAGLALNGREKEALEMFSRMERTQIKPNAVTFLAVLSACSHFGLVEMGSWYLNRMDSRYGIKPKIEHFGCMIDLLGRAGYLQEARELVREMPFEANRAIWGSLLAASRIHGDVGLGEQALQHLIKVEPHNSGNYSLLSNLYAGFGRWNDAGIARKLMRDTGIKKVPGGSSIEVNNRVHEFNVGDISHPQSERIYKILSQINGQLKIEAHVHGECWWLQYFALQNDLV